MSKTLTWSLIQWSADQRMTVVPSTDIITKECLHDETIEGKVNFAGKPWPGKVLKSFKRKSEGEKHLANIADQNHHIYLNKSKKNSVENEENEEPTVNCTNKFCKSITDQILEMKGMIKNVNRRQIEMRSETRKKFEKMESLLKDREVKEITLMDISPAEKVPMRRKYMPKL